MINCRAFCNQVINIKNLRVPNKFRKIYFTNKNPSMLDYHIYNIFNNSKYLLTLVFILILIVFHLTKKVFIACWRIQDYEGKSVLITGCDSGFGYNAAIQLNKLNVKIFAACFTKKGMKRLEDDEHFQGVSLLLDVTSQKDIDDAFQLIQKHLKNQGSFG